MAHIQGCVFVGIHCGDGLMKRNGCNHCLISNDGRMDEMEVVS